MYSDFINRLFTRRFSCTLNDILKKSKLVKLFFSLCINGIICLICLASVVVALVDYQGTVTTSPTRQLTVGTITDAWTIYVNEVNQVRCVPDQFTTPTLDTDNTGTYSFKVVTDANKVCAVKVELVTAMDPLKFSKFDITVSSSTGGWVQKHFTLPRQVEPRRTQLTN